MENCNPPYKYGDKGGWCDCSFKDVPNAPGCFRPECWDRIKFYYYCNTRPDCPDRVIVIEICDTNASRDDNIKVTLNGVVIANELDFSKDERNGYFLIADPSATLEASESSIPNCYGSTPSDPISVIRFDPNVIVGGVNTINVKVVKQNYNGNAGSFKIRTYCNNNGNLINGCQIAEINYGSEGDFTFNYDSCCGNCPGGACPPCPTPTHTSTPTPTPTPTVTSTPHVTMPTVTVSVPSSTPIPCSSNWFSGSGYNAGTWSVSSSEQKLNITFRVLPPSSCNPIQVVITSEDETTQYAVFQTGPGSPYFQGGGSFCKPAGVTTLKAKVEQTPFSVPIDLNLCDWQLIIDCSGLPCDPVPFLNPDFLSFNNFDIDQNNQKISSLSLPSACSTYCGGSPANENLCLKISNYIGSTPDSPYKVEGSYPITINPSICYNYTGIWTNDCSKPSTIDIETIDVTGNGGAIYMSHKTKIGGVCVDLTLTSAPGSVGSLCGSGVLSSGSGVAKINDVADGTTFNWEITSNPCITPTPTPTPTYAPGCYINFQIATRGCCIEYLSNEIIRAVGDGAIYLYNINQNPSKCCKKFTIRVNGGLIYKYGEYFYKNVKDGDILLVQAYNECKCNQVPVPTYAIAPTYKQPIGYNAAECPSYPALRAVKDSTTSKIKIILNKNLFRR